jgi:hypothetical protein
MIIGGFDRRPSLTLSSDRRRAVMQPFLKSHERHQRVGHAILFVIPSLE